MLLLMLSCQQCGVQTGRLHMRSGSLDAGVIAVWQLRFYFWNICILVVSFFFVGVFLALLEEREVILVAGVWAEVRGVICTLCVGDCEHDREVELIHSL